MCLRNILYPLVKLDNGKKHLFLNYGIKIKSREIYDDLKDYNMQFRFASLGVSKYEGLNKLVKSESVVEFLKFVNVPCGCCRECLNDLSRQWAFRIMKEAELYDNNYFITLTYSDEHLPDNRFLVKDEISKFNKKLKVYLDRNNLNSRFRFYGVGEYGSGQFQTEFGLQVKSRPHYHVIYFDLDIPDLQFLKLDENKNLLFTSELLSKVWGKGFVTIGAVDIGSACYVARYCDKKRRLNKTEKDDLISKGITPEFSVMSRMPGIGSHYLDKIKNDFENGLFKQYLKGKTFSIPLYYSKKIKEQLEGSSILLQYEQHASFAAAAKVAQLLNISDVTDLDNFLDSLDVVDTKRKL